MKIRLVLFALLVTTLLSANSVFSFSGMPIQHYGADVYGTGMGDTGSADLFRINPNYTNPSLLANANKVFLSTSITTGFMWYEDDNSKYRADGLYFPYFSIAVPIGMHRIGFNFNQVASGNLENEMSDSASFFGDPTDLLDYTQKNSLQNSLIKADFMYAYKNKYLNVGMAINYYLGHQVRYWEYNFSNTSYEDAIYELEKNFKNPGYTVGVSKKFETFSVGASYNSAVDLDGETKFKYAHYPYTEVVSDDVPEYYVPARFNTAVTQKLGKKFKISVDSFYEMWSEHDNYEDDSYKIGVGFAYDPLSGYGEWYNNIPYRFGYSLRQLPFEVNENKIMEKSFSFGTSIPLKSSNKKLDLAVQYLTRGDIDDHGMQDSSLSFSIGITGFDIFSKRRKKTEHRDIPKADL